MNRTLLQVVQEYLDATSGFYIDSIFDTDESQQVAKIAERVYYGMVKEYPNLLFTMKERNLGAVGDLDRPTNMTIPEDVTEVSDSKVYYNVSKDPAKLSYKLITYVTPPEFLELTSSTGDTNNSQLVITEDYVKFFVKTNQFPSYFTSFNDKDVVFDAIHKDYDDTLQASKTRVIVSEPAGFLQEDDFVIPVPANLTETYIDLFLNEALTLVHQQPIGLIANRARAKKIKLQQDNRRMGGGRAKRRFGRQGLASSYIPKGHNFE